MRWVSETPMKPVWAFSATGQITECNSVKTMESEPSPNHSSANGSSSTYTNGSSASSTSVCAFSISSSKTTE